MTTPAEGLDLARLAGTVLTAPDLDAALVEVARVSARVVRARSRAAR
jgi:hypothetical protein